MDCEAQIFKLNLTDPTTLEKRAAARAISIQRRLHWAPISTMAAALLRTIRLRVPEGCEWVFPGDAGDKLL
jgi:hypothetical protein